MVPVRKHNYIFHKLLKIADNKMCRINKGQGRPQDLVGGGGQEFFFRFWNLHVASEAMRIARGVRGHAPPRIFFKTVQFGAF